MLVGSAVETLPAIDDPLKVVDPILVALMEGRERIRQGWIQGAFVRNNADGKNSYCMVGAVIHGYGDGQGAERWLEQTLGTHDVPSWNDNLMRTHEEVIIAFDRAIETRERWLSEQTALSA